MYELEKSTENQQVAEINAACGLSSQIQPDGKQDVKYLYVLGRIAVTAVTNPQNLVPYGLQPFLLVKFAVT